MSTKKEEYNDFLLSKVCIAPETGFIFDVGLPEFLDGTVLKPHQRDAINWAIKGGRRALFESFGLGKTIQQLLICKNILEQEKTYDLDPEIEPQPYREYKALIVCPLGVRQEFFKDAKRKLGIDLIYVKTQAECESAPDGSILITNYERVRDGNINPKYFIVTSLDEASVLRSYGSKTYQTFLDKFKGVKYKFVCTATPSPNKYKELIHYAGYLEIMDTGQALTRFFKRDSTQANNLTIYPHKEKEFWLWMSTWALFITKPSDLRYDDTGYDLPPLKIIYHKVKVDHKTAGLDQDGQVKMFRESALGLKDASREKRDSLDSRILEMKSIIDADPDSNYIIWHDLEKERHAIMQEIPKNKYNSVEVFGTQDMDIRERNIVDFADGKIQYMATKPEISGQGCNFQYFCHKAIFLGIGYEFNAFIQAIHRIYRFQQEFECEIHIIYAESEQEILKTLQKKWKQHDHLVGEMIKIIKENGLSNTNTMEKLKRSIMNERFEEKGKLFTAINTDAIPETMSMPDNSIHLGITSIPFANHYEYTPYYNDFGHNHGNDKFFVQMDYLTPHLLRTLKPGRIAAIHVKDRIRYSYQNGTKFTTVDDFSGQTVAHFIKHGFYLTGKITVTTDVVAENNQTNRLTWKEQRKDATRNGVGSPEYILIFRKAPSHNNNSYADEPVTKDKEEYDLATHQVNASSYHRSDGNRLLSFDEIKKYDLSYLQKLWKERLKEGYNYEQHVQACRELEQAGKLSRLYTTLPLHSNDDTVWSDVNRMNTLNTKQVSSKKETHICPLQLDIIKRLIDWFTMPGELVDDPFGGLFSTPYMAMQMGRKSISTELNSSYFKDGVFYVNAAYHKMNTPTLFDCIKTKEEVEYE